MDTVWTVTVGDRVKNFESKRAAIRWLRELTKDTRITPVVERHDAGRYTFYGPGRTTNVVKATIVRCSFASLVKRSRKPLLEDLEVTP